MNGANGPDFWISELDFRISAGFQVDFWISAGFQVDFWILCGFQDFVDFRHISGFRIGFLDFTLDFWIWIWISYGGVRDFSCVGPLGSTCFC